MCGITGFWSAKRLEQGADRALSRMMDTLTHRGPDGRGALVLEDKQIAFGHTRLSINDLGDTGAQPIVSADGRYVLSVNGEFYDFKRARARLMALGDRFSSRSDSEIAISLYHHLGVDFLAELRGEFAFALYDSVEDQLLLVRDRFGVRPLFYHVSDKGLVYGSEAKALLVHPDVPRRLSSQAVLNQLMHTMVPGTSAFAGVAALEPGHFLRIRRRGSQLEVEKHRYWDMTFPHADARELLPAAEHIEAVREKLIDAIVLRLEADVPVGCYLSGGIDSCSILGLASGAQQSPVKAFTIAFDHQQYDESSIATEMAQSMAAEQELIRLGAEQLYGSNYLRTAWHAERTFYNTLGVAKWCMSRRVRECGYKTVITGEGADELFGGYPAFKVDMFLHGGGDPQVRKSRLEALARSNALFRGAILADRAASHPAFEVRCGFTPAWIQPWMLTLEAARPLLSGRLAHELQGYDPVAAIAETLDPEQMRSRHPLDVAQYSWSKTMLEGQILNWGGDRVDMANSMESRPAFLDHHLAEVALRVPPELRIKETTEKWVQREAVKGVLPSVLYQREKFAFMAPPAHTDQRKRARLEQLTDRYLSRDAVERADLFDPAATESFLVATKGEQDPSARTRQDALLNHLLCLQIIHAEFIEKAPSAPPDLQGTQE